MRSKWVQTQDKTIFYLQTLCDTNHSFFTLWKELRAHPSAEWSSTVNAVSEDYGNIFRRTVCLVTIVFRL